MPPSTKTIQMHEDVAVIKSQLSDVLHILKDNGSKGLVTRVGCAENDIQTIKGILEREGKEEEKIDTRKFEMSKGVKFALFSGCFAMIANLLITIFFK